MFKRNFRFFRILVLFILIFIWAESGAFAQVPAPEEVLGFKVGDDYKLATYEQALEYLKALEKASPKIKLFEMGKTDMGKPMIYAVITSVENMKKLDHYKEISKKLARTKGLNDEEAHRLAAEGKAVVYIEGGVHAAECATTQSQIQLAYDLLARENSYTRLILDNVIFLLVFANPDGMQMLAEWYLPNVGTPYETSPLPWKPQKYTNLDINRDSYMGNLSEARNVIRLVNDEWYPVIFHSQHHSAPFPARIWFPPAAEPTNPNLHPLFIRGKNLIGSAMGLALDERGQEGGISRVVFDFWYPGYGDSFCDYFHVVSILTESAHYKYATPKHYTVADFPEEFRDLTVGALYPSPWKGGWWRFRDSVEYCLTASMATLHTAALYRENFLYNRYQMGRDTINRFRKEPPYAWIIPQKQWDTPTTAHLLNTMIMMGIDVCQAEESFESDDITYPAGTWVIPMDQPFALFVKALFEEQTYPDLIKYPSLWQGVVSPQNFRDAYIAPYDMTGWTLPYQFGVKAVSAQTPLNTKPNLIDKAMPPAGRVEGSGKYYLLSPKTNNSFIAVNRILKKGGKVQRAESAFDAGGRSYPAGTMIVHSVSQSLMDSLAQEFFLEIGKTSNVSVKAFELDIPRIALYMPWIGSGSDDEGWTRLVFEKFEFPYESIHDAQVRAGDLRKKFDVIVFSSLQTDSIVNGNKQGTMPEKYVGGITEAGVANIRKFMNDGGTLITLDSACLFAIEKLGLPVSNALKSLNPSGSDLYGGMALYGKAEEAKSVKFACPGSILRMRFNNEHPVAFGMPEEAPAFFRNSPAFDILPSWEGKSPVAIAKYPEGSLLMSGFLRGEQYLHNKFAAVEVPFGKGRAILLGFGVQQRVQPHGTFKLLFNSLFYGASKK